MNRKQFVSISALVSLVWGGSYSPPARAASFYSSSNLIPSPDEVLASTNTAGWVYSVEGGQATSDSVRFFGATGGVVPPTDPLVTVDSFFDVFVEISLHGLPSGPLDTTVKSKTGLSIRKAGTDPEDFVKEITQLDIAGGALPPGLMLRESPTLQSIGQTKIESLPGGQFRINSFFDIFTELSLDGGQTWHPASGPIHLESTPEPSTLVLGALGLATLLVAFRRTKLGR